MKTPKNLNLILKLVLFPVLLSTLVTSCGTETSDLQILPADQAQQAEIQYFQQPPQPVNQIENGVFQGVVTALLPDDRKGLKHELFMVKITSPQYFGAIVNVAHDINYAPYVPVRVGASLEIKGDLITNIKPMVLHWTHRAYDNSPHPDGYIKFNGQIYN